MNLDERKQGITKLGFQIATGCVINFHSASKSTLEENGKLVLLISMKKMK